MTNNLKMVTILLVGIGVTCFSAYLIAAAYPRPFECQFEIPVLKKEQPSNLPLTFVNNTDQEIQLKYFAYC